MNSDKFPPVADIDESQADPTNELTASDLEDLSNEDQAENARNHTPTHIRELGKDAPYMDESSMPTVMLNTNQHSGRNTLITLAVGLAAFVVILLIYRSSQSSDSGVATNEVVNSVASVQDVTDEADVEDFTIELDEDTTATDKELTVTMLEPRESDAIVKGYNHEKCAAPKTDRAWLECASAAYSELRLEQKQNEARIASLESRNLHRKIPDWMKVYLFLQFGLCVVLLLRLFRNRKGSVPSAS